MLKCFGVNSKHSLNHMSHLTETPSGLNCFEIQGFQPEELEGKMNRRVFENILRPVCDGLKYCDPMLKAPK